MQAVYWSQETTAHRAATNLAISGQVAHSAPARLLSMSETDLPDGERPKIKVTDRRLFDSDGNLRDTDTDTAPARTPLGAPSRTFLCTSR